MVKRVGPTGQPGRGFRGGTGGRPGRTAATPARGRLPDAGVSDQNAGMDVAPEPRSLGVIEVDTYCVGCQYNLHGQAVSLDDRLGLPVCRCPECGRFHPAGVGVSAAGTWARRLATLLLFAWVAVVVAATVTTWFFMGAASVGSVAAYTTMVRVAADGGPAPAKTPAHFADLLHPIRGGPAVTDARFDGAESYGYGEMGPHGPGPGPAPWLWLSAGSLALGTLAGGLCVTLLWHWPRGRYLWCVLLPALPAVFVAVIYLNTDEYQLIRGPALGRAASAAGVQAAGVLIGIGLGRKAARLVARTVIPPKPRQLLAFLWHADGLAMPPVAGPGYDRVP